jgi:tetratricopeptide (TPR) repeat protein
MLTAVLVCCAARLTNAQTHADDRLVYAERMFKEGLAHFNLREYHQALTSFAEAYRAEPDPAFLFNMAQTYRKLGRDADASEFYRKFLRESPNSPKRAEVEALLKTLPPPLATPPLPVVEKPTEKETRPPPVVVRPTVVAQTELAPPARRWYRSAAGWTMSAIGVAAVAAGAGLAVHGGDLYSQAETAPTLTDQRALGGDASTYRAAGWATLGVGAASVLAGVIVFAVAARKARSERRGRQVSRIALVPEARSSAGFRVSLP